MNNFLIEYMPLSIAANTITVFGLLVVFFSHFLVFLYAPKLQGEAPGWVYVVTGLCLFIYQTLDNLDGKQARRTKTSSPLGLLMDHGCDALNITVSSLTFCSTLQTGATWKAAVFWQSHAMAFYFATWEEYYTGELVLPVINGPTEGLLIGAFLHIVTGLFLGGSFWAQKGDIISGVDNNTVILVIECGCLFFTIIHHLTRVYQTKLRKDSYPQALSRLLPFVALNVLAGMWLHFSPTDIMALHPRLVCWTLGLLFAKLVTHLMLAHLCEESYHPFRRTLVPFFALAGHVFLHWLVGQYPVIDEELVVIEFFLLSLASYAHLVFWMVYEVKTVLNVMVFTVPKRSD
eukprot:TRINITY_DN20405_c0_g1::TRINITY_DN20405_c0_g1_i1::g.8465::m.8465 TRINITY_DN20405_c0_g1::TRINITY_DN20405_c0_g1_i1::g.8465  ORF type:complete len:346 (-),score=99.84,sp/O82567/AAPT1_ARATH/34.45/2e-55,CDP-OH_P_transf/PF01066.16/1.8e-19,CDP-OH_P_transf/PF01066.16/4.6e+03,CDP-OH_P_transf/PF01066.16/3.5e+03 TRINITY_DN20405_c0_g1_i1:154-1191(-)